MFHDALETLRDGEDDNVNVKIPANNDRNNNVTRMGRGRKLLPVATPTTIVGIVTLLLCSFAGCQEGTCGTTVTIYASSAAPSAKGDVDIAGITSPLLFDNSIIMNNSTGDGGSSPPSSAIQCIPSASQLKANEKARPAREIMAEIKGGQARAAAEEEVMVVTPENDDNGSDVEALYKCTDIHQSMFMFTTDVSGAHVEIQNQDKDEDTSKSEAGLPSSSPSSSSQPSSHPSVQPTATTAPSSVPSSNPTSSGVPSLMVSCLFRSSKSAHIMCVTIFQLMCRQLTNFYLSLTISIIAV